MQIFVINLEKDKKRYATITESLNKFNLKFERIDAVYGASINRSEDPSIFTGNECLVRHNCLSSTKLLGNLTDGELGCALSHLNVYKEIVKRNLPGAIILEDDFIVTSQLDFIFSQALQVLPNADVISGIGNIHAGLRLAFWHRTRKIPQTNFTITRLGIPGLDWFFNRRRRSGTTSCYYVSNKACQRLLKIGYPVRFESDVLLGMVAYNKLAYYAIEPKLGESPIVESSIGEHGGTKFI